MLSGLISLWKFRLFLHIFKPLFQYFIIEFFISEEAFQQTWLHILLAGAFRNAEFLTRYWRKKEVTMICEEKGRALKYGLSHCFDFDSCFFLNRSVLELSGELWGNFYDSTWKMRLFYLFKNIMRLTVGGTFCSFLDYKRIIFLSFLFIFYEYWVKIVGDYLQHNILWNL